MFLDPHDLAPGGLTGIAVIINHFTGWYTGLMVLAMNIPLIIAGLIKFGKEFLLSTVWSTVMSSVFMSVITKLIKINSYKPMDDFLLCAITGGALMGIGLGIVFRQGGTTGGSDIIVKFMRQKYRHLKSGVLFICLDSVVVSASAIAYRNLELGLYAGVAVFICSIAFNAVLYGTDTARLVFIVSENPEKITKRLLCDLDIGVTYVQGVGGYTNKEKKVIMCASKKRMFPLVKQIVREEDPAAFMIVTSANEIYGEGFKLNSSTEL
jgi:uncharacterized membrane-anchored protein YitT (DUF2179 family)